MIDLPLMKRATEDDATFVLTPKKPETDPSARATLTQRMPSASPGPGEQYRFHVDMGSCIGCKCCVVACNEQNGNPAALNWRRVGEIEGGWYPNTQRSFLSMGCNHCVEPTCLSGCPVDAYTKDPSTGIVLHSADTCIGCQYCTWNCSYGVPQYNPERGVVGKCDMCHSRLGLGQAPACVSACPTGAIAIEVVKVDEWRALAAKASGPGLPIDDGSLSTTRITLPRNLPPDSQPVDLVRLATAPADPHWPLVIMTVLTQLSVGTFAVVWLLQLVGASTRLGVAALSSLVVASIALAASTMHLGRPVHAYRAIKAWKRSWLSREVVLFGGFSGVASAYAAALWFGVPGGTAVGVVTVVLGLGGVTATGYIYRVPSRPAWNTPFTLVQFLLTSAILGLLFANAVGAGDARWLVIAAAATATTELVVLALRFFRLISSSGIELQASGRLLATTLRSRLVARGVLLAVGALALPLSTSHPVAQWIAFALALVSELLGRYLFFVSAVPKHMAAPYLGREAA
ncbi:MAG: DmsC/YnfH family molybdoenzyme membrane anchor subunit [Vicinamibacterales bacterium]